MLTTDAFSRDDILLLQDMSLNFHRFLIYTKFKGNYTVTMFLRGMLEKDPIVDNVNISSVHFFLTWKLCFGADVNPLWLIPDESYSSVIDTVKEIADSLGKFSPRIMTQSDRTLRFDNGNQLVVSTYFPNAGCGMSLTDLILERCPSESVALEMKQNLCPPLYGATKGKGRVFTIV